MARGSFRADDETGVKTAERKAAQMSAAVLKRKLRNFPAANLSERIPASS
jgi:hypothetical protein